jgi:transposase
MSQPSDLGRCPVSLGQDTTLVAVIGLSQSSWLVAGTVPGIERQPLKKILPDGAALLRLLHRWRGEAIGKGRTVTRVAVAFEAGRDGFGLARWLAKRGIETHVTHSSSVAVSREHKRAETDRLDTAVPTRVFLGWLRGERGHCTMVAVPTVEQGDAKRPSRERESLTGERTRLVSRVRSALARLGVRGLKPERRNAPRLVGALRTPEGTPVPPNTLAEPRRDLARLATLRERIKDIGQARPRRLGDMPQSGPSAMVRPLASVVGVGIETACLLAREVFSRDLRDRRAVARHAGPTGAPDEGGSRRRETGLARAGNARVRRGMVQPAWRLLPFQQDSALAKRFRSRTEGASGARKTKTIAALARKPLIALWRTLTTGEAPHGVVLRPAA